MNSVGDLIGNVGRGIFGSGEAPDYTASAPSEDQQRSVYANQDAQNYDPAKVEAGIAQDVQMAPPETFSQRAIQDRARKQYGDYLGDMKSRHERESVDELQRQRMNNMDFVNKVQRLVKHVQDRRAISIQNQTAARNRVVGGIIGAAGAVVGGIYGGPTGAYMGSQAGNLAGPQQMQQGGQYKGGDSGYGRYQSSNDYGGSEGLADSMKG